MAIKILGRIKKKTKKKQRETQNLLISDIFEGSRPLKPKGSSNFPSFVKSLIHVLYDIQD